MVKSRTRQHQAINQSHSDAGVDSMPHLPQHSTGLRAMTDQRIADLGLVCRYHKRLTVNDETHVANEAFVKNFVDLLPFKAATLRQPLQSCAFRAGKVVHVPEC